MSQSELQRYSEEVIGAWDEASGNFKWACEAANDDTSIRHLFDKNGGYELKEWYATKESIDGVGTKLQIYTSAFEAYIKQFEAKEITDEELFQVSVRIWKRGLSDLIAMNTDDLREGEMAVAVTNIIDINHLKGLRGKVFADSMAEAMGQVIRENDIMMTAGETAILGEPKKVEMIQEQIELLKGNIKKSLDSETIDQMAEQWPILRSLDIFNKSLDDIMEEIEFNIGGTSMWISTGEKLVELEQWQIVVAIHEKPKDGIIGPRSNGITAIRKGMRSLGGSSWESLSFENFLEVIGDEKASLLSDELKSECAGLQMWEIATWETTIFNPFVSRVLLGGVEGSPKIDIASLIHVTGNPVKKIEEWLGGKDNLGVDLDISNVKIPQIIEILQCLGAISDEDAMSSWNMGVPYVIVCNTTEDAALAIDLWKEQWFDMSVIWEIKEKNDEFKESQIKWVWIGDSTIEMK